MRLPTIKLMNKKTGERRKINQTDYARDIARWSDWKIITMQSGDAPDNVVQRQANESDVEKFRRTDPARQKWSGDAERAFKQRSVIS